MEVHKIRPEVVEARRKIRPPIRPEIKKGSLVLRDPKLWHAGVSPFQPPSLGINPEVDNPGYPSRCPTTPKSLDHASQWPIPPNGSETPTA